MIYLIRLFVRICQFKERPDNVPKSDTLLLITAIAAIISAAITTTERESAFQILSFAIGQVILYGASIWVVLKLKGFVERWHQTITAMYGATTILQLVAWPFVAWHARIIPDAEAVQVAITWPLMAVAAIAVWSLAVMANILKQAMEIRIGASVLIVLGCQMAVMLVLVSLLAPAGN